MSDLRSNCKYIAEELEQAWQNGELFDYLNDKVLDITFIVSPPKTLRAVELAVTLGGPSIYIDTREHGIVGFWGSEKAYYGIDYDLCNEIEQAFAEMYDYEY